MNEPDFRTVFMQMLQLNEVNRDTLSPDQLQDHIKEIKRLQTIGLKLLDETEEGQISNRP